MKFWECMVVILKGVKLSNVGLGFILCYFAFVKALIHYLCISLDTVKKMGHYTIRFSFSILLFAFLWSCSSETKEKCKYGEPVAIFSDDLPGISGLNFSGSGQIANEEVVFDNGLKVVVEQSGCNNIRQVFHFTVERPGEGEPNWFLLTGDQFNFIGNLSSKLEPMLMWASVINSNAGSFNIGEPLEVEKGFFIKIDKIDSGKDVILSAELSENLYESQF